MDPSKSATTTGAVTTLLHFWETGERAPARAHRKHIRDMKGAELYPRRPHYNRNDGSP